MTLQKKYYFNFSDIKKNLYTVEIWQNITDAIIAEEITGGLNPFSIEYPNTDIFEAIKGSGCELRLISTTDRKFLNLYTADMLEYQIRLYNDNSLIWCGFLDSELYTEPFNESKNYTVSFTGTDGFALLERINYINADGSNYLGLSTQWDTIKNIINKLNLPYKNIYVGLSTVSNDITISESETIFHQTYCNNQNWYNEDGEAETSRKVLESILQPYSAFIIQDNANLYITDINTIAGSGSATFNKYDSSFNYVSTESINLVIGDLDSIKFSSNTQQLSIVSGFNKQIVKYSPYIEYQIIKDKNEDYTNLVNTATIGTAPYQWEEKTYSNSNSWTASNNGRFCELTVSKVNEKYLKILKYGNDAGGVNSSTLSFTYKKLLPLFIPSNCKLVINGSAYVRTLDNYENPNDSTNKIYHLTFRTKLKIGDKQYYHQYIDDIFGIPMFTAGWTNANDNSKYLELTFDSGVILKGDTYYFSFQPIDNNWVSLKVNSLTQNGGKDTSFDLFVPLTSSDAAGLMQFEIYDFDIRTKDGTNHDAAKALIKDVRLKDFSIKIVDKDGNEFSDSDIEYVGYMNRKYKDEGKEITLYQGTSKTLNSIEKASMIGYNSATGVYYFLSSWTRQNKTDCLENLLLRSIVSNYTNKRIELTADVNKINSTIGCITYSNYFPDKSFMIVDCTHNLSDCTTSITLQEITVDNLEINKSW